MSPVIIVSLEFSEENLLPVTAQLKSEPARYRTLGPQLLL
jgi:hypothetical protein